MTDALTTKQALFVDFYLGEAKGNATRAAELAGYSDGGGRAGLRRIGSETLAKPDVATAVRARLDELGLSQGEILAELADIARAEWRELVEVKRNHKGEIVEAKFNLRDKLLALELLARCRGMLKDPTTASAPVQQIQVKNIFAVSPYTEEESLRATVVPPAITE
ncbi:MAG: terminase small subunit [Chloroflexota bacterium]|nr:terminase small subunit [Chloroflexota bacterium]